LLHARIDAPEHINRWEKGNGLSSFDVPKYLSDNVESIPNPDVLASSAEFVRLAASCPDVDCRKKTKQIRRLSTILAFPHHWAPNLRPDARQPRRSALSGFTNGCRCSAGRGTSAAVRSVMFMKPAEGRK
jgi:hypothetical protein